MLVVMASALLGPMGTSTSDVTTQPTGVEPDPLVRPGVEKNFKPQSMLVGDVASTLRMADIMVVQRWAQVTLAGSHGLSSEMLLVIDPERSSTRSKSAGNWAMLLALLPQFKVEAGFEGTPPSIFKVTLPPVPGDKSSDRAPPLPDALAGSPTTESDEQAATPVSRTMTRTACDFVFHMASLLHIASDDAAAAIRHSGLDTAAGGGLTAAAVGETDLRGGAA
jgi:hypothetical protein